MNHRRRFLNAAACLFSALLPIAAIAQTSANKAPTVPDELPPQIQTLQPGVNWTRAYFQKNRYRATQGIEDVAHADGHRRATDR